MALTPSNMLPLGTKAPTFTLPDSDGQQYSLELLIKPNGLLVMFISNHCPYVIHIKEALATLSNDIHHYDIGMVAINANDAQAYPDDSPQKMAEDSRQFGYAFPYLFDESQQVAKAYDAACTPDCYLFDGDGKLVYRGQFDDSRPGNDIPVSGKDLLAALSALKQGHPINPEQKPSIGCNIKWKR